MTGKAEQIFESHRRELTALAYRMLGDLARAEDLVQEAWLKWQSASVEAESPRAYLVTIVTRLCLNELDSARVRLEEARDDRLPEPVSLEQGGLDRLETLDRISMAFLVVLQQMTPAERAVLLLHDVFDFDHAEIARLVEKTPAACRKLLERAKRRLAAGRPLFSASREEHDRLLKAFIGAAVAGDVGKLAELLAADAVMTTDGGRDGASVGRLRNLPHPLRGAANVAAFVIGATNRAAQELRVQQQNLNGQPAMVLWREDKPFAALLLGVAEGKVQRVFFHADATRLRYLLPPG